MFDGRPDRRCLRAEDGVRGLDERHHRPARRRRGARAARAGARRALRRMDALAARAHRAFRPRRHVWRESLALGLRDGRDCRCLRGGRPAARLPRSRRRGLSPAGAVQGRPGDAGRC